MDRRVFLAGGIKTGIGLGLGARSARRALSPGGWLSDVVDQPAPAGRHDRTAATARFRQVRQPSRPHPSGCRDQCHAGIPRSWVKGGLHLLRAQGAAWRPTPEVGTPAAHGSFPRGATPGLMILDTSGDLVWFKPLPGPGEIPFNFRVQTYKGKPTLTWFQGAVIDAHGVGHYVLADNTYQPIGQVVSTQLPL